jgi:hypothetical protein
MIMFKYDNKLMVNNVDKMKKVNIIREGGRNGVINNCVIFCN